MAESAFLATAAPFRPNEVEPVLRFQVRCGHLLSFRPQSGPELRCILWKSPARCVLQLCACKQSSRKIVGEDRSSESARRLPASFSCNRCESPGKPTGALRAPTRESA